MLMSKRSDDSGQKLTVKQMLVDIGGQINMPIFSAAVTWKKKHKTI